MLISQQVDASRGTIDLSEPDVPQVDPLQQVRAFAFQLTPAAQAETARLVAEARAASPDVVPAAGWADVDDPVGVIEATGDTFTEKEVTMTTDNRVLLPNGKVVHVDQAGQVIPPARNAVDDYAAAQQRTAARFGPISLANESDRGHAVSDWDETERRAAGELVEPSAERDAFVVEWARENSHLVPHGSTGIAGLAAPGRPMRAGVGFNADGSRGYHDQMASGGYETADRQFCRPGENDAQRRIRVDVDDAGLWHFAKLEMHEYVKRQGL